MLKDSYVSGSNDQAPMIWSVWYFKQKLPVPWYMVLGFILFFFYYLVFLIK
jgi:hypothetical protein